MHALGGGMNKRFWFRRLRTMYFYLLLHCRDRIPPPHLCAISHSDKIELLISGELDILQFVGMRLAVRFLLQ